MNIKNAWIWHKALKSKKYIQGRFCLRSGNDAFCCLGVLCEVAIENGCKIKWLKGQISADIKIQSLSEEFSGLNANAPIPEVYEWLGIEPEIKTKLHKLSLDDFMGMNDNDELNFDQIADELEKEIKGYEAMV